MTPFEAKLAELRSKLTARLVDEHTAFVRLLAENGREEMLVRAHKLAGIAGMLGAPEVGELARALDEATVTGADFAEKADQLITLLGTYGDK